MEANQEPATGSHPVLPGPHWGCRTDPEASAPYVPLRLVMQPGGAVVELSRPDILVGRHSEADLRLPLPDVSRRHCRFQYAGGSWQVQDLDSLNGVFLNGDKVQRATLHDGDLLAIGGFRFEVRLNDGGQPRSGESADADEVLQRIAGILPRLAPDSGQQRKAS